jgi:hypothetical protein
MVRLLQEMLVVIDRDILHPIRVYLKKKECLPECIWLTSGSLISPCLCFYRAYLGAMLVCPYR